jgi:hypothetical protein
MCAVYSYPDRRGRRPKFYLHGPTSPGCNVNYACSYNDSGYNANYACGYNDSRYNANYACGYNDSGYNANYACGYNDSGYNANYACGYSDSGYNAGRRIASGLSQGRRIFSSKSRCTLRSCDEIDGPSSGAYVNILISSSSFWPRLGATLDSPTPDWAWLRRKDRSPSRART